MLRRNGPTDRVKHRPKITLGTTLKLLDHDQLFPAVDLHGEHGPRVGLEPAVALLDRPFDVLRVEIHAVQDDQVLDPASDEQLAVLHESQVAGP